jgi:predicted dehydrogenase
MQNLRAAVIGVGYLGAFHAEKYHSLPGVELIAVVDTNLDKAMQVASRFGAEAHAGHRKILEQVDVVSIAAPTLYHYPIARDCLEAGLHVLLEKPITDTLSCAQSLIELARKNGLVLQIGHLEQFNPAVRMIHKNIVEPIYIECHRMAPFSMRGADVDVVLDLMIHDI